MEEGPGEHSLEARQAASFVGTLFLVAMHGTLLRLQEIEAGDDPLPPTLPHEVADMTIDDFNALLIKHRRRMEGAFGFNEIKSLRKQHADLKELIGVDSTGEANLVLRQRISKVKKENRVNNISVFERSWSFLDGFELLKYFICGFATAFVSTCAVERDHSIVKALLHGKDRLLTNTVNGRMHLREKPELHAATRVPLPAPREIQYEEDDYKNPISNEVDFANDEAEEDDMGYSFPPCDTWDAVQPHAEDLRNCCEDIIVGDSSDEDEEDAEVSVFIALVCPACEVTLLRGIAYISKHHTL
eukprot:GHVU01014190.1.p1 GENE.GHVU01014190.1~~GHVU01014190.1.p1  ORF type:complete len:340 (-),score=40.43 GHVU01014190.1:1264-2166(-)